MTPSELIDNQLAELTDWRGAIAKELRHLIVETDPGITEEWKWQTAAWNQNGTFCAMVAFKDHVKLNFLKGASLPDPDHLFNAGLEAKTSRAIDIYENDSLNTAGIRQLITAAISLHNS
jgi:hypothetical protein